MKILILDNNSEYLEDLIKFLEKRRINYILHKPLNHISDKYDGVIASGGAIPRSRKREILNWYRDFLNKNTKPFLGICLGHKILGYIYGARIKFAPEKGVTKIFFTKSFPLTPTLRYLNVYQDHDFGLAILPKNIVNYARSSRCSIQAIKVLNKPFFGVQFHPEIEGGIVLENFLKYVGDICGNDLNGKNFGERGE